MYPEINERLGANIPKSTLSTWCRGVKLPENAQLRIRQKNIGHLNKARTKSVAAGKIRRSKYINEIVQKNRHYQGLIKNPYHAKLCLSVLYLGEGAKSIKQGSVAFGNSNGDVIQLFIQLLRYCYKLDENKFRCTVQCRADQDTYKLTKYWQKITRVPLTQFYKPKIDKRTIGKPTRKPDYKGVCRVDYFSAYIQLELLKISDLLIKGARSLEVKR